jgi:hypothetical protein
MVRTVGEIRKVTGISQVRSIRAGKSLKKHATRIIIYLF